MCSRGSFGACTHHTSQRRALAWAVVATPTPGRGSWRGAERRHDAVLAYALRPCGAARIRQWANALAPRARARTAWTRRRGGRLPHLRSSGGLQPPLRSSGSGLRPFTTRRSRRHTFLRGTGGGSRDKYALHQPRLPPRRPPQRRWMESMRARHAVLVPFSSSVTPSVVGVPSEVQRPGVVRPAMIEWADPS